MMIKKSSQRLLDATYDKIYESLSSGSIRPGDWLRQASIAEELDVSQATVRDALNKLVMEGLAERVPRKGVRIPFISSQDLADIYDLRIVAEGLAWEAAALKITEADLARMRALLPLTGTNADPASVEITRRKNKEFHMIAIQASQRWTLINVLTSLLNFNNLYYLLTSTPEQIRIADGQRNIAEHEDLLAALEKRDPGLAKEWIVNHIKRSMSDRVALQNRRDVDQ
jgi:DNA-binding GntR family transcriptional regulator